MTDIRLPYFHWPSFIADVRSQRYMKERAFFATVMAVCAISAARIRDGAGGASESRDIKSPDTPPEAPASELFYDAAKRAFPSNLANAPEFDYKRAKVLLAMLCIQYGHVRELTTNLGDYMSLCATDGFHNEARWPPNLRETELQERRRVVSSPYTKPADNSTGERTAWTSTPLQPGDSSSAIAKHRALFFTLQKYTTMTRLRRWVSCHEKRAHESHG